MEKIEWRRREGCRSGEGHSEVEKAVAKLEEKAELSTGAMRCQQSSVKLRLSGGNKIRMKLRCEFYIE